MGGGARVVLGVTGSIAAYKAAEVVRLMRRAGMEVHVVMTRAATELVAPATFQALSGNPVHLEMFSPPESWDIEHIELARQADAIVIAPATANCVGKLAAGIADDLLTTVVMAAATERPVLLAPAMNRTMYANPIVRGNLARLQGLGYIIISPAEGELACGEEGQGRMAEPANVVAAVQAAVEAALKRREAAAP
jgi:phosphopantothenoylcysteine decarboxylase/phosphopantothenate--cysteine ligase